MSKNRKYRLKVQKSLAHVYAVIIETETNKIITESSTLALKCSQANVENCTKLGEEIGKKCKELKINSIAFDRNSNIFHGRVKAVAEGARSAGLEF
jgi:large subunit ribosomal protein L18